MAYEEWTAQVSEEIRTDALWQMEAYRRAMFLYDLAWEDCEKLVQDVRGREATRQIVRSAGSIAANIEEGFGRGFGRAAKPDHCSARHSSPPTKAERPPQESAICNPEV